MPAQLLVKPRDFEGRPVDPRFVINVDDSGNLVGGAASPTIVAGGVAAGAADSGNPVKVGAVYTAVVPVYTTGQRTDLQANASGALKVELSMNAAGGPVSVSSTNADGLSSTAGSFRVLSTAGFNFLYNGATWDRVRGDTTGAYSVNTPTASANNAIVPVVTAAVASSLVVKAAAGNLYGWRVVSGASAGYVMIFNAVAAPADGAVTPVECVPVAANASVAGNLNMPERYTTGITIVFSTTGPFVKTASATAFIRATAL